MNKGTAALRTVIDMLQQADKLSVIGDLMDSIIDITPMNTEGLDTLSYGYYQAKEYKKAIKKGIGLYIYGPHGVAKTTLSTIILNL